jgi:hypothetical protein
LLRCILDSHSQIHAPHELHLRDIKVTLDSPYAQLAVSVAGLEVAELEHLLWDRLLHQCLAQSGKNRIVDKTPGNVLQWGRIANCWPDAQFIFLLRHPAQILESAYAFSPKRAQEETKDIVLTLTRAVEQARQNLPGLKVHYEHLTRDPRRVIREICQFLGIDFESTMLTYRVPATLIPGIGDATEKIRSGRVLSPRPFDGSVPPELIDLCQQWGYADAPA